MTTTLLAASSGISEFIASDAGGTLIAIAYGAIGAAIALATIRLAERRRIAERGDVLSVAIFSVFAWPIVLVGVLPLLAAAHLATAWRARRDQGSALPGLPR